MNKKIAIATPTQTDFDSLMGELKKMGKAAFMSDSWMTRSKDTCVAFGTLPITMYGSQADYIGDGYTILTPEEGIKYLQSMENEAVRSEVISKENLRVGDVIIYPDGSTAKVLAISGDIFARSIWSKRGEECDYQQLNSWVTFPNAVELDWKIKLPPTTPVKMTVAEIAKKLGYEVEVVK